MADISTKELRDELALAQKEAVKFAATWKGIVTDISKSGAEMKKALNSLDIKDAKDIAKLNELTKQSAEVTKLQTTATKEQNAAEKEAIKLDKQLKMATDEEVKGKLRLQAVNKAQRDALKDELVLLDKSAGTLARIAAENRKLRRERQGLNLETKKGTDRLKQINKQLDANNVKIQANSDKLKKQKINVGNYTESTKEAINASGLFSSQIAILTRIQGTMNAILKRNTTDTTANATAQKGAAVASGGFSKALKVLRIALISTGIGAIVVGLGSLIAAFAGTQRGADAFSKALIPIQTIFQKFIGFLENTAFKALDALKEAIDNPKQAFIDLGQVIVDHFVTRFNGFVNTFKSGGAVISNLFTIMSSKIKLALSDVPIIGKAIDVDQAKEDLEKATNEIAGNFKELGNSVIQSTIGVEGAIDKLTDGATGLKDAISEAANEGLLLDDLIKRFEKRQIALVLPLAKARLEFQELRAVANDLTKTDQERITALNEAEKIQRFIASSEKELINLKIKRMELEQSFNDTSREEELELANLKAEAFVADANAQKKINSLVSLRSGIEKRALDARNKSNEKVIDDIKKLEKQEDEIVIKRKTSNEELAKQGEELRNEDLENFKDNEEKKQELQQQTAEAANKLIQETFAKQEAAIDKELEKNQDAQSKIQKGIEAGNEDAKKSLAEEERNQLALERKKEANRKKAQQAEAAIALFKAYGENGGDLGKTIGSLAAIVAAVQSSPTFYHGTDETGSDVIMNDQYGGITGFVHAKEQVWSQKDRADVGFKTRNEIKEIVNSQSRGLITDPSLAMNVMQVDNDSLILEVRNMRKEISTMHEKIPIVDYNYDAKNREHQQVIKYHNKVETIRKKASKTWA